VRSTIRKSAHRSASFCNPLQRFAHPVNLAVQLSALAEFAALFVKYRRSAKRRLSSRRVHPSPSSRRLLPALESTLRRFALDAGSIPALRRSHLDVVAKMLAAEIRRSNRLALMFICTHNSRRSQLSHAWAQTIVQGLGLPISVSSGGTGPTAVHPSVIAALRTAGFRLSEGSPTGARWLAEFAQGAPAVELWSKKWDCASNPKDNFITIANCAAAEESCPNIPGALARLAMLYEDPRLADGTEHELDAYLATSTQIGIETSWMLDQVASPPTSAVKRIGRRPNE